MTREEAKQALERGEKVRHESWHARHHILHDGVMILMWIDPFGYEYYTNQQFWPWYEGAIFDTGWEIYNNS